MAKISNRHLLRFRVYINPMDRKHSPYYWCTLWRTANQARARAMVLSANPRADVAKIANAVGFCYSWDRILFLGEQLHPEMGEIILCNKHSGSSTIYHECCHAAHRLAERIINFKLLDDETPEERMCLTVGWMGRQIVLRICALDKRSGQ